MDTGNSVADYRVVRETCSACEGTGEMPDDYDEMLNFVHELPANYDRANIVSDWFNGKNTCPACDGKKTVEAMR